MSICNIYSLTARVNFRPFSGKREEWCSRTLCSRRWGDECSLCGYVDMKNRQSREPFLKEICPESKIWLVEHVPGDRTCVQKKAWGPRTPRVDWFEKSTSSKLLVNPVTEFPFRVWLAHINTMTPPHLHLERIVLWVCRLMDRRLRATFFFLLVRFCYIKKKEREKFKFFQFLVLVMKLFLHSLLWRLI